VSKNANDVAYSRENNVVDQYRDLLADETLHPAEEYHAALNVIFKHYESLLNETKLLTSLGDRLQRKLRSTNLLLKQQAEEIQEINNNLNQKNIELKLTIDELTRAKASRKAQTYLLIITFLLFMLSESLENFFDNNVNNIFEYLFQVELDNTFWASLPFKILILLLFKPIEGFLEKFFLRQAMDKDKRELLKKVSANPTN
jgi:hypothetical protein